VPVKVTRRIGAPTAAIFGVLADPGRHTELDGSGMLRGAVTTTPISGVGDVFVMKMYFAKLGDYEMNNHVVEYEPGRRIGWEPEAGRGHLGAAAGAGAGRWGHRWSYELVPDGPGATFVTEIYDCSRAPAGVRADMDDGEVWAEAMARTLERLEAACTRTRA
jgi:polyketide cyclase/dehydrase/lipid transport protein